MDGNSQPPINPCPSHFMPFEPPQQYPSQPALFHHIQTYHVKSIKDTSSKHIKPLWLSAATEGPMHQAECEIDTGAGCNVMPSYMYRSLFGDEELMPTSVQIFGYGASPKANLGACMIHIHTSNNQPQMATCQVTDTRGYLILGRKTAQQGGYINFPVVTPPALTGVSQVHTSLNALRPNFTQFSCRTSRFQKSFFPSAITGWNSLDLDVRNSVSLPTFKAKLRSTLFPHCYNKLISLFLGVHLFITPV